MVSFIGLLALSSAALSSDERDDADLFAALAVVIVVVLNVIGIAAASMGMK